MALQVSINTDDQGVFDTSLENEYAIMTIAFIGLYVRGEVKRSSDAGKEEKK